MKKYLLFFFIIFSLIGCKPKTILSNHYFCISNVVVDTILGAGRPQMMSIFIDTRTIHQIAIPKNNISDTSMISGIAYWAVASIIVLDSSNINKTMWVYWPNELVEKNKISEYLVYVVDGKIYIPNEPIYSRDFKYPEVGKPMEGYNFGLSALKRLGVNP